MEQHADDRPQDHEQQPRGDIYETRPVTADEADETSHCDQPHRPIAPSHAAPLSVALDPSAPQPGPSPSHEHQQSEQCAQTRSQHPEKQSA